MLLQYGGQTCALTVGEFSQTDANNETKVSLNMTEKQQQFETGKDSVEINVIATPGSTVHISIDDRSIKKQTDSAVQTAKNCPESRAEFKVENTAEILITELKEPERLTKSPAVKTAPNTTNSNAAIVSKVPTHVETSTPRIDNNNATQQPAELKSPVVINAPTVNENNKDTNNNVITSPGAAISPAVIQNK